MIENYLIQLQEQEEIQEGDHMICEVCGREVTINKAGQGPLVCCGQPMKKMKVVVEAGFSKLPKGWTEDSVKKFAKTLSKDMKGGPKSKGFFDKCVEKMKGKVNNPEGFCAGLKDEVYNSTYWRGGNKSPSKINKLVKTHKNV